MYNEFINLVKSNYPHKDVIPLHEPVFIGEEKSYVQHCIESSYVSSVGQYVDDVEKKIAEAGGAKYAIATMNGTAALHICLLLAGVLQDDEVITQPLTFVATCNAISYCRAYPVFIDVDIDTLGMSPQSLYAFLERYTYMSDGMCFNRETGRRIKACVPMHTFGHPCKIDEISKLCEEKNITVIQDSAESLGTTYQGEKLGKYTSLSSISFNGNKIVTAGGGGAILCNDKTLATQAKHLTTTARKVVDWNYTHDEIGFNYRMPNLNAALLYAQLENLEFFVKKKRALAKIYSDFFSGSSAARFLVEPKHACSNYWLNTVKFETKSERDNFLQITNEAYIYTRGSWDLMCHLKMYKDCFCESVPNSINLAQTIVNLPSTPLID